MSLFGFSSATTSQIVEASKLAAASYATVGLEGVGLSSEWRALTGEELGFRLGIGGVMSATGTTFTNDAAAAQVYISRDGQRLAVSFRGTDQPQDAGDYLALYADQYISFFRYFLERVADYARRSDVAIAASDILITGHSLGAGAAHLLRNDATIAGGFFQASDYITIANPLNSDRPDILNIGFDNDFVFKVVSSLAAGENDYINTVNNMILVHDASSAFGGWENWDAAHDKFNYIHALQSLQASGFADFIERDDFVAVLAPGHASVSFTQILGTLPWTTPVAYVGNAANNLILAGQGSDRVFAADAADTIHAGPGADQVWGGTGNDVLNGQAGVDTLRGGADQDSLYGGTENDVLHGDDGNDRLQGQDHNDNLFGGIGVDTLFGEAGNDTLDGGAQTDRLIGGVGDDLYIVDADVVAELANEGIDTIRTTNTRFGLGANIENLVGFNALPQFLVGNVLDNRIVGSINNDTINGWDGNDTIDGGLGTDRMIGGFGDDRFIVDHALDVVVEFAGQGFDTVVSSLPTYTLGPNVDDLVSANATSRTLIGNTLGNWITGNAGADTLNGAGGNDVLTGYGGNDRMIGGPGDDYFYIEGPNDVVLEFAAQGIDTINTASASYRLPNFIDDLDAGYFINSPTMNINTNRSMIGNNLDNIITTNRGNDVIYGLSGDDTIYAGDGRDVIIGGAGADLLVGGTGDDVFLYLSTVDAPTSAPSLLLETIVNFENGWVFGNDRIDLSRIDARAGGAVNEAFTYIGSWWFSGQAGELRVVEEWLSNTGGGYNWAQVAYGDVDGDAYADFKIAIQTSDLPDIDWFIL